MPGLLDRREWLDKAIAITETDIARNKSALRGAPGWLTEVLATEMVRGRAIPARIPGLPLGPGAAEIRALRDWMIPPGPGRPRVSLSRRLTGPELAKIRRAGESLGALASLSTTLAELTAARTRVPTDPVEAARCYKRALLWLNEARTPADLISAFRADPASLVIARARVRKLSTREARTILGHRALQPRGRIRRIEDLASVPGISEFLLWDLVYTGCFLPLIPLAPTPTLGVLLPVRLETRFYPPDAAHADWLLRLRVVPDSICVERHDEAVGEEEFQALRTFWEEAAWLDSSATAAPAWRRLVAKLGGARATWLRRKFPVTINADGPTITPPANFRTEPDVGELRGIPSKVEIWLARGGAAPALALTLQVKRSAITQIRLPDPSDASDLTWWSSYARALAVGMAGEISLGAVGDDIDVIYAVGLSTESPKALFEAHHRAGQLALLPPGTPTNTVHGDAAAPLDLSPEEWAASLSSPPQAGAAELGELLLGNPAGLNPIPGGDAEVDSVGAALISGLWPVLWGHAAKDIWGLGDGVHDAGVWAGDHVRPEGPWPTLRVGRQPYGLLPTTALSSWEVHPDDPAIEEKLRPHLLALRAQWAAAAEGRGTVAGADTEALLAMLGRTGSSHDYVYRHFLGSNLLILLMWWLGQGTLPSQLMAWWTAQVAGLLALPLSPQRVYIGLGWQHQLRIPLVVPDNLGDDGTTPKTFAQCLQVLLGFSVGSLTSLERWLPPYGGSLPNSLLFRLLVHARLRTDADSSRKARGLAEALDVLIADDHSETLLSQDVHTPFQALGPEEPARVLQERVDVAIKLLSVMDVVAIERAFRAVLDAALYRIDPWITAFATRRVHGLVQSGAKRRLGWYGWVDSPRPGGAGPTAGGLLHAPSEAQCLTAVIIRDKQLHDPQPDRWDMDLDSGTVRVAKRLAGAVRVGGHLAEVLGREVERVVGTKNAIEQLRQTFPLRVEHDGRRPCDGQKVLAADEATLGLPAATLTALKPLRAGVDAYGDLLVAEAVHHVVQGRGEVAGAAMKAAAGLSAPPSLEVLKTPRTGRRVASTVLTCLPDVVAPALTAQVSPTQLADPAVADWLQDQTALPGAAAWTWDTDLAGVAGQVTLADLSLGVSDAAVLAKGMLEQVVVAHAGVGAVVVKDSAASATHRLVRRLATTLGTRPALPEHAVTGPKPDDADVREELRKRLKAVKKAAELARDAIDLTLSGTDAEKSGALRTALRWGIQAHPDADLDLDARVSGARDALITRLEDYPADPLVLSAEELGKAIAELATDDGAWPVLSRIDLAAHAPGLTLDARGAGVLTNPLDDAWLAVVAPVRPALASLEAVQLEAAVLKAAPAPLAVWTNLPGDAWQQTGAADPDTGRLADSRLIVVYGPDGVLTGLDVAVTFTRAVGLIDQWSEVVPEVEHATTAAFGFNAPAARAPQAVLLAASPRADGILDNGILIQTLVETRELARARMAGTEDLGAYAGGVPTSMFPAMGDTRVDLLPWDPP